MKPGNEEELRVDEEVELTSSRQKKASSVHFDFDDEVHHVVEDRYDVDLLGRVDTPCKSIFLWQKKRSLRKSLKK